MQKKQPQITSRKPSNGHRNTLHTSEAKWTSGNKVAVGSKTLTNPPRLQRVLTADSHGERADSNPLDRNVGRRGDPTLSGEAQAACRDFYSFRWQQEILLPTE